MSRAPLQPPTTKPQRRGRSAPVAPAPPAWLDEIAAEFWRRHARSLAQSGRLEEHHRDGFAMCCEAYSRYRRATLSVPKRIRGKAFPPALAVQRQAMSQWMALSLRFGLDPASDARLITVSGTGPVGGGDSSPPPTEQEPDRDASWHTTYGAGG